MGIFQTYKFIEAHPLTKGHKWKAFSRLVRWQIASRLLGWPVLVPYVNDTRLIMTKGMTGATGNLYCGLHEFNDMAFALHFLRPEDLFVDVGANVGSYTVLAGSTGASVMSFEPVPTTFDVLLDNININRLQSRVEAVNSAVGAERGELMMTADRDTTNQAVKPEWGYAGKIEKVSVTTLDGALENSPIPALIKIDVEGFESKVISGAHSVFSSPDQIAVIMELNGSATRYGVDEKRLHQQMLDFGYSPYSYNPLHRELTCLRSKNRSSGNVIYLKNENIAISRLSHAKKYKIFDFHL